MASTSKSATGINYGQPGQLIYTPRKDPGSGVGTLHSTRLSSQPPSFDLIGTTAELYPPTKTPIEPSDEKPSHERYEQKRWLRHSHPEALPGLGSVGDFLKDELSSAARMASAASTRKLLDIGQISDLTSSTQRTGAAAIAMAAGEAGEKLRIARITQSKWAWEARDQAGSGAHKISEDVQLELAIIDPDSWQDECLWTNDGLPFTQIKFATHSAPHEPLRWLLAQKATSTSILSPEYHKVPIGEINVEALDFHMPSKIDPRHELTITHTDTGGRVHCDVAFNPPGQGSAAQIAIMDECGYWTVWAVIGRTTVNNRHEKRAILRRHGHVIDGLLPDISYNASHPSRPHGALFVGVAEEAQFQASFSEIGSKARAPYLLVWDPDKIEIADFDDGTLLQPFQLQKQSTSSSAQANTILDAQVSPVVQSQVFILSAHSLLWIDVPRHGLSSKPSLILECPHLPATRDLRMSVCRVSDEDDTAMVFLYAPGESHFSVNWLSLTEDSQLPRWHRQVLPMVQQPPDEVDGHVPKLDIMLFHSSKLAKTKEEPEAGPGEAYSRNGVLFFQGLLLSEDLGLRYCVAATSEHPGLEVELPDERLNWTYKHKKRSYRKQRRMFLKHIGKAFVLPDGLEPEDVDLDPEMEVRLERARRLHVRDEHDTTYNVLNLCRVVAAVEKEIEVEDADRGSFLPASCVDLLENVLDAGVAEASVPLFTWQDVIKLAPNSPGWVPAPHIEGRLKELKEKVEDEVTMPSLWYARSADPGEIELAAGAIHQELVSLRGQHQIETNAEGQSQGRISVAQLASDCFLSAHGFVIQDVTLFGQMQAEEAEIEDNQHVSRSQPPRSSQSPGRVRSSSPASAAPVEKMQAPFRRLQLLAPSLKPGSLATKKLPKVLSHWPAERGAEIGEYVSSVATESDARFDDVRQRLQKAEARKKAQAEKLKRPAYTRQGFPEEERGERKVARVQPQADTFRSSPQPMVPMSSQSQGQSQRGFGSLVTMSQPTAGAFGDRKKTKKAPKKKSGFR